MFILIKGIIAHLAALDSFPHLCPLSLFFDSFPRDLVPTRSLPAFRCFLTQYTTRRLDLASEPPPPSTTLMQSKPVSSF
jgi:hypothetical protein